MEKISKYSYSRKISRSRNSGKLDEAINIALEATENYPNENIFEKILGDLYLQNKNYDEAGKAYINFLTKIDNNVQYVKHFAHFMERYSEYVHELSEYLSQVQDMLDKKVKNESVIVSTCEIISHYIEDPEIKLFANDKNFKKASSYINKVENSCQFYILYYKILAIEHTKSNRAIDKYVVSLLEKRQNTTKRYY